MRVLFLDFDGVLNTGASRHRNGLDHLDPNKVALVDALCRDTGAAIVISSDWRTQDGLDGATGFLRDAGLQTAVAGGTPAFPEKDGLWGGGDHRAEEIVGWLDKHSEVTEFAVVDDLRVRHPRIGYRAVLTSDRDGLLTKHVRRLRKILSGWKP